MYSGRIYNLGLRMLRNSEDAEDMLQETFITAFQKLGAFQGRSSFYTWIYRIATNIALGKLRQQAKFKVSYSIQEPEFENLYGMKISDWPEYVEKGLVTFDDLKTWDFHHPVVPTKHLSTEEVGRLGAWALREFYSKPGRVERIMYSKKYHPYVRLCFRSYLENMSRFEKTSSNEELYV
jgi:RNA polymerase sigma factor (sigma-70 family)